MVMMFAAISSNPLNIGFGDESQPTNPPTTLVKMSDHGQPDYDVEVQVAGDETPGVEGEAVVDEAVGEEEVVPGHDGQQRQCKR